MLSKIFSSASSWGLFPLRAALGTVFLANGARKLLAFGFDGFAGFLAGIGVPGAAFWAVVVILVEILGGLAILIGMFTRYAAAALSVNMLIAIFAVHAKAGFFLPNGVEYALTLMAASLTLLLMGGGPVSLDSRVGTG
ncbi:MAG: DoxX family protein [Nitrospinota bacterium]